MALTYYTICEIIHFPEYRPMSIYKIMSVKNILLIEFRQKKNGQGYKV
jgi:hypothetical protein